ncbi:uncharacterized protein SPAPADRAFT_52202 [Spathaspora passalidarum NRRL Y-27907]|uniref:Uncharacterized protein n=1 Tax=Spathaspora passalidarum (strain NRRL Y-27907 / 11-Y1) TaxID=619300 RepID=G3AS58_SPAPN|nr:uncharacterized protein SPAPADRAFT_52202 [Spathaspora passalidarum NRRL Y-27907]EGW31017.1 hypothetical protein SPAPADRAFT_52202 [Spathaspora passalidarum NRRL Y-27907]
MFFSKPTNPKPFIRVLGKLAVLITNSTASNHQIIKDNQQFYLDDTKRSKVKEFFRRFKSFFLRKVQTQIPVIQSTATCMFQFTGEVTVDSFSSEEEVFTLALKPLLKTGSPSTIVSTADVVNECPIVDTFELPVVTADDFVPKYLSHPLVVPAESIAAPISTVVESACALESSEPTEAAPESVPIAVTTDLATEKVPDLSRSNRKKFKKLFKGIRCSIHRTKNYGSNSQPHTFIDETAEVREQSSVVDATVEKCDKAEVKEQSSVVDETAEVKEHSSIVDITVEKCDKAEVENVRSKRQRIKNLFRKSKSNGQPTTLARESPEVKEQPSLVDVTVEVNEQPPVADATAEECDKAEVKEQSPVVDATAEVKEHSSIVDITVEKCDKAEVENVRSKRQRMKNLFRKSKSNGQPSLIDETAEVNEESPVADAIVEECDNAEVKEQYSVVDVTVEKCDKAKVKEQSSVVDETAEVKEQSSVAGVIVEKCDKAEVENVKSKRQRMKNLFRKSKSNGQPSLIDETAEVNEQSPVADAIVEKCDNAEVKEQSSVVNATVEKCDGVETPVVAGYCTEMASVGSGVQVENVRSRRQRMKNLFRKSKSNGQPSLIDETAEVNEQSPVTDAIVEKCDNAEVKEQSSVVDVTVEKCDKAEVENVKSKRQRMKNLFRKSKSNIQPTTLERESPEIKEQPSLVDVTVEECDKAEVKEQSSVVDETAEVKEHSSIVDVTVEKCDKAEVENVKSKRQRMKNLFRKSKSNGQPTTLARESSEVKEHPSIASTITEKKAFQKVSMLSINESSINRTLTIGTSKSVLPAIASAISTLKSTPVVKLPTASAAAASTPVISFGRSGKCASAFDPSKKVYPVSGSLASVDPAKTSKPVIPNFTSGMACTGLSWNTQIGSSKDAMKWRDQNSQLGNKFGAYMEYNYTSTGYNDF